MKLSGLLFILLFVSTAYAEISSMGIDPDGVIVSADSGGPVVSPVLSDLKLTEKLVIQSSVSAVVGPGIDNVVFKVEAGTMVGTVKLMLCTGVVPVCSLIADNLGSGGGS